MPQKPLPPPMDFSQRPLNEIVPDGFPQTQQTPVINNGQPEQGEYGKYYNKTVYTYPAMIAARKPPLGMDKFYPDSYDQTAINGPRILAHEAGHAMHAELDAHRTDFNNPTSVVAAQQLAEWDKIHDTNVAQATKKDKNWNGEAFNMKDPFERYPFHADHSFADAYGAYATDPEWLQKTYPNAYNYFKNLLGFEYSRKPKK